MAANPLRCAVVGAGHLGQWHAAKYALLPDVELVAIADTNPDTAARIAAQNKCQAVADYRDLIGVVDAVSIATPTTLHFQVARDFLQNGCHVLVEKPITTTVAEAQILNDLAQTHGRVLQVGHLERFNPALQPLLEEKIEPRFIESHRLAPFKPRATDVSVVLDLMIHDIDIILDLVKAPITDIRASGARILTRDIDIATARLEFADGCVANVTSSRVSAKSERKMRIFQPHGYASIDFQNRCLTLHHLGDLGLDSALPEIVSEQRSFPDADALLYEIQSFVSTIQGRQSVAVDGHAAQRALATAIQITDLVQGNLNVISRPKILSEVQP